MDKYKNKYRIKSHRKPNWNYSADGLYFLTIITQNRECNLGEIVNNEMILSDFGKIVEAEWFESFEIRKELILHMFVLMPNHLHTIVEIFNVDDVEMNRNNRIHCDNRDNRQCRDTRPCVSTIVPIAPIAPIVPIVPIVPMDEPTPNDEIMNEIMGIKRNPPIRLPKSISSFIAGFKSAVNTQIDNYIDEHNLPIPKYNRNHHFFQPNYHDHIIRNNIEYWNISNYIINNPMNWRKDKFYV